MRVLDTATFEDLVKINGTPTADADAATIGHLKANVVNDIHPDSANYLEKVDDGGVMKLRLKQLGIIDVSTQAFDSLTAFINDAGYDANAQQEGDVIVITGASPNEIYMHNGGTAEDESDWIALDLGLDEAAIKAFSRKLFSGQTLVANTPLSLAHNLNQRGVHVSCFDNTNGQKVEPTIVYTDANNLTIESAVGLSNIDVTISI